MPAISSQYTEEHPQADGRRWVYERHTLESGEVVEFAYLADPDVDAETVMRERARTLGEN